MIKSNELRIGNWVQDNFENHTTAISFIKDFSKLSAEDWCLKQGVDYWM